MKNSIIYLIVILLNVSCSKYLDEKPDRKLSTISSLEDCQALLDRRIYINGRGSGALEAASDNYFFNMDYWGNLTEEQKNLYTWQPLDNYQDYGFTGNDWSYCFDNIFRANAILEALTSIKNESVEYDDIKGQAYFLRANNLLQAAWTWCLAYEKSTSTKLLGLPLRLTTDFNKPINRSGIEDTYKQIISDTRLAIDFLPDNSRHVYRASKPAAYALMARIFLSMNQYDSVLKYSDLCLNKKSDLLNFNDVNDVKLNSETPFKNFNKEVLYEFQINHYLFYNGVSFIDTNLVNQYTEDDLRRQAYFLTVGNYYRFKGSYNDDGNFTGLTTAEVLLMKSESAARLGSLNIALDALNKLRQNRITDSMYMPVELASQTALIDYILVERRKELLMRGLRFMDIKRLNALGYNISLKRRVNDIEYVLPAGDKRFALPIPDDVISNSGLEQNPR